MSSTLSAATLRLDRRPSRRLAIALLFLHLGALGALWLSALPAVILLAGTFLVLLHLRHTWRRHVALSAPSAVRQLSWVGADDWQLRFASDEVREQSLRKPFYITAWMTVLRFDDACVVLLPDALDRDTWRQLRVSLRALNEQD